MQDNQKHYRERLKNYASEKTIWIKRLINICSFAFVKCSFTRIIKKLTEVLVNIINNKAELLMKKIYLITEIRSWHLLHTSTPLWLRMGPKISPNEGVTIRI